MKKIFLLAVLFLCASMMVGACGKMSKNEPVEGSGYPHIYPRK
jgi:hypothetical protein